MFALAAAQAAEKPLRGVCYGPFRNGQSPETGVYPTRAQLREDLLFAQRAASAVRMYGNERTLKGIPVICADLGLACYPAAYLGGNDASDAEQVQRLIAIAARRDATTKGLIVGNESQLFGLVSQDKLVAYLRQVRAATDIPVSTAEPWHVWKDRPALVAEVDYILVHCHPFWETPPVPVDQAARFVADRVEEIRALYPGLPVVVGETGWPSSGPANGGAVPGEANQEAFWLAFDSLAHSNSISYFAFELFDEAWKGEGGVGAHWGLCSTARPAAPKDALEALIRRRTIPAENAVLSAGKALSFWWWAPPPVALSELRVQRYDAAAGRFKAHTSRLVTVTTQGFWKAPASAFPAGTYRWSVRNSIGGAWQPRSPWRTFTRED
jgi:exo-beta-1,3-glucanase (GH17 family)